jgi:hypothetical protein
MSDGLSTFAAKTSAVANNSIVFVGFLLALVSGFLVFVIIMYLVFLIAKTNEDAESKLLYNNWGCRVDASGKVISQPLYSSAGTGIRKVVGYNNCVTKTPSLIIYGAGFFFAAALAFIAGDGVYKIGVHLSNRKLEMGLRAANLF